jgi:hypothetical protein
MARWKNAAIVGISAVWLGVISAAGLVSALAADPDAEQVVAMLPLGTSAADAFNVADAADVRLTGLGRVAWIASFASGPNDIPPARVLPSHGAWLLLDAERAAWLCGVTPNETRRNS